MIKFGTDGWRSLMSDSFNVENVKKVAQAIAGYMNDNGLGEKGIVIGYDTRHNSDTFAKACAQVMIDNNIKVFLPNRALPTPLTAFAITDKGLGGAIMITASHNPAEYNGIKFIPWYAGPATEDITRQIEENLGSRNLQVSINGGLKASATGDIAVIDPVPEYKEHIKDLVDLELLRNSNLNILVNPMFGAAYGIFADVLRSLGLTVEELDGQPDPDFGGLTPEPIPRNLVSTINTLKNNSYDMVLALDGDADRFGVFDSNGTFIQANYVLALIADYLVSVRKLKGALVRSVATTHFLDHIAHSNGLEAIETPVGFKHIGEVMRNRDVILGGEESAGLSIQNHIPEKDGLLADLLVAEIGAYYKKPLAEIVEDLFKKYNRRYIAKRLDLELTPEAKDKLIDMLKNNPPTEMAGLKVAKTIDIDGMKFILEEGSWLLARPSGTEPVVRIYLESDSTQKLEELEKFAKNLL